MLKILKLEKISFCEFWQELEHSVIQIKIVFTIYGFRNDLKTARKWKNRGNGLTACIHE